MQEYTVVIAIVSPIISFLIGLFVVSWRLSKYDSRLKAVEKEVEEQKVLHEDIREIKFAMNILLIHVGVDINKYKQV